MNINPKKIYSKFIRRYQIFGIESDYHNLHQVKGPEVPKWLQGQVIYEIYVRAFSKEGTFNAVRNRLSEIKSLEIDVIWFMPIFPIGQVARIGKLGCPYSVRDYFNVNPEYGTQKDFRNLVKSAHDLGMRIIIDLVANHVAHDYVEFRNQPDLVLRDENGIPTRKVSDWSDVVDLDYANKKTWNHVLKIMQFWIKKFDIDGFRCDVAGLVPTEFWEWAVPQIQSIKPDIFLLAEWESPLIHKEVFHSTYDWILYSIMLDVIKGQAPASDLTEWIVVKKSIYPKNSQFLRFLENHDKDRALSLFNNYQLAALLVFIFSIDGLPLIYNGQEIGDKHYLSLFEKESIDWRNKNKSIEVLLKKLIGLRKKYKSLSSKNYHFFEHNHKQHLLIYRKTTDIDLLILINFSEKTIRIPEIPDVKFDQTKSILFNTHSNYNSTELSAYQGCIIQMN